MKLHKKLIKAYLKMTFLPLPPLPPPASLPLHLPFPLPPDFSFLTSSRIGGRWLSSLTKSPTSPFRCQCLVTPRCRTFSFCQTRPPQPSQIFLKEEGWMSLAWPTRLPCCYTETASSLLFEENTERSPAKWIANPPLRWASQRDPRKTCGDNDAHPSSITSATARPATARPATARPATARPATARPALRMPLAAGCGLRHFALEFQKKMGFVENPKPKVLYI